MKKLFTLILLAFSISAEASIITLDVSTDNVSIGESITVNILASGFVETDTFNFDLVFDSAVFAYDPTTLSSDLFASNPFALYFEANAYPNRIGFSFLDFDPILDSNFVLASFDLTALQVGSTQLAFSDVAFYQPGASSHFALDSSNTATITVAQSVQVPEPATWLLLLLPLLAMSTRQKFNRTN